MTPEQARKILESEVFVASVADLGREKFDPKTVGAEMLNHGFALLMGISVDEAKPAVFAMLKLHESTFVDAKSGGTSH
jgi:hypothetical protein